MCLVGSGAFHGVVFGSFHASASRATPALPQRWWTPCHEGWLPQKRCLPCRRCRAFPQEMLP